MAQSTITIQFVVIGVSSYIINCDGCSTGWLSRETKKIIESLMEVTFWQARLNTSLAERAIVLIYIDVHQVS